MDPQEYELMYHKERQHWWYLGMEAITRALLRHWAGVKPLRILDAGCGTGAAMTTYLAEHGNVTGIDISPLALDFCRLREAQRLVRASLLDLPFAPASFDLVASLDVIYEQAVPDDLTALKEISRVLAPGGLLLLRVPAYDWLRGRHDRRVHTARRYTAPRLAALLQAAGLHLEHLTYANMFLFPLLVTKRWLEHLWPSPANTSDLSFDVGFMAWFFRGILTAEALLASRCRLPLGSSVIAIGRKKVTAHHSSPFLACQNRTIQRK
ncbi:MAG: class I SAM-dependent methyltransferase [Anaerolineales bacterium]